MIMILHSDGFLAVFSVKSVGLRGWRASLETFKRSKAQLARQSQFFFTSSRCFRKDPTSKDEVGGFWMGWAGNWRVWLDTAPYSFFPSHEKHC